MLSNPVWSGLLSTVRIEISKDPGGTTAGCNSHIYLNIYSLEQSVWTPPPPLARDVGFLTLGPKLPPPRFPV